jgi:Ras family protein
MGFRSVGKSTVAIRFVNGSFVEIYNPTVENIHTTTMEYKGEKFLTEIVDTAGQVCRRMLIGV